MVCAPPAWAGEEITIKEVKPIKVIGIKAESSQDKISATMGPLYHKLYAYMGKKGIAPAGPPLAVWYTGPGKIMKYEACMQVSKQVAVEGDIQYHVLPGGKMVHMIHKGPYKNLTQSYGKIMAWINKKGITFGGPSYEIYLTDPANTKPADYQTEILMPFKKK